MTVKSHSRGHEIVFKDNIWIYSDTLQPIDEHRQCKRCGKSPTIEGYDACLSHMERVISACCGHGVEEKQIIKEEKQYEI